MALGPSANRVRGRAWYRRAPTVVSYWKDGQLVLHNYLTAACVAGPPVMVDVLHHFDDWRQADELTRAVPAASRIIERLADESFLERWDGKGSKPSLGAPWSAWGPAPAFLHFSTKDDFDTQEDLEKAEGAYQTRLAQQGVPPTCKHTRGKGIVLEKPSHLNAFEEVLAARRTWREFGNRPLDLAQIGRLLWWAWGVHGWIAHRGTRSALRTSPSAGARQAIELYVVARRTKGLASGFYHYEMDRHRLVRLPGRVTSNTLKTFLPRQWWFHDAAVLFVMTAVFDRVQVRYPFARAYRSVLLEAGHFCQTFCLAAESAGLAPFCTHALADRAVEAAFHLDGINESVVYAAGAGHKPVDQKWRPWPAHEARHPYRPPRKRHA